MKTIFKEAFYMQQLFLFGESDVQNVQEEPTSSGLDLLGKFGAIDISVKQRISEEEAEFCKLHEGIFFDSREALKKALKANTAVFDKYKDVFLYEYKNANFLSEFKDIKDIQKKIDDMYYEFVRRITRYFSKRYNVTIAADEIETKYTADTITFSLIVDEIFEQLGGLTFEEKAVGEIKAASKDSIYNTDQISITKNKLSILNFVYWCSTWDNASRIPYNDNKVKPLFIGLSHFIYGAVNMEYTFRTIYNQLESGSKNYDIFSKYEIKEDLLQSIKFYKNGKVELVFTDNSAAEQFKTEYLV